MRHLIFNDCTPNGVHTDLVKAHQHIWRNFARAATWLTGISIVFFTLTLLGASNDYHFRAL
jgi:hypothetical protein